jgi:hypothetical protein
MRKRTRARHFGDNPRIRHSHREHISFNIQEPWERYYRGVKKSTTVRRHHRKGTRGVRSHIRRHR